MMSLTISMILQFIGENFTDRYMFEVKHALNYVVNVNKASGTAVNAGVSPCM